MTVTEFLQPTVPSNIIFTTVISNDAIYQVIRNYQEVNPLTANKFFRNCHLTQNKFFRFSPLAQNKIFGFSLMAPNKIGPSTFPPTTDRMILFSEVLVLCKSDVYIFCRELNYLQDGENSI